MKRFTIGELARRMLSVGILASVTALAVSGGFYQGAAIKVGVKAPPINTSATDGKSYTVPALTKKNVVVLYFIKEGCPVNKKAAPYVEKIAKQYGLGANIVGVYNGDVRRAKEWAAHFKATFPILADPDYKIIDSYKAPYSPFLIVVDQSGKIAKVLAGAGPQDLPIINQIAAKNAGKKMVEMDFKGAPPGGGCSF